MHVLVTGGYGFIGSHVIDELAFNVASGEPDSVGEMADVLADAFGPGAPRPDIPTAFAWPTTDTGSPPRAGRPTSSGFGPECRSRGEWPASRTRPCAAIRVGKLARSAGEWRRLSSNGADRRCGPGTLSVHGAGEPPGAPRGLSTQSHQSSAFDLEAGAQRDGWGYTRVRNPTVESVGARVACLEGADDAVLFASGVAAIATTLLALLPPGGRIVAARMERHNSSALRLGLIRSAPTLGGVESLISAPCSSSHCGLSEAERASVDIVPGTLRLSVGIEEPEDLIDDLARALAASASSRSRRAQRVPAPEGELRLVAPTAGEVVPAGADEALARPG